MNVYYHLRSDASLLEIFLDLEGVNIHLLWNDLHGFVSFLSGQPIAKGAVVAWKEHLTDTYAPATVDPMPTAVNGSFHFMDWPKLSVGPLKVQRPLFCDESREMTRAGYVRLWALPSGEEMSGR